MIKLKLYLWTLERWFAFPIFGASAFLGVYLAGGNAGELRAWLGILMVTGLMCFGHTLNSFLDYEANLDKGEIGERSASKSYSGGQSLIASGKVSEEAVIYIALVWAVMSAAIAAWFLTQGDYIMILFLALGIAVPFAYTQGKFSFYHELSLGIAVGPLALLVGMYAVSSNPPIIHGLMASIPFAIILAFAGLSLDEWPDAEANLKKGVKSLAFKIWAMSDTNHEGQIWSGPDKEHMKPTGRTYGQNWDIINAPIIKSLSLLQFYVSSWLFFMVMFQIFLIVIGVLSPMTGIALLTIPVAICLLAMLKWNFNKVMLWLVFTMGAYSVFLVVGQAVK